MSSRCATCRSTSAKVSSSSSSDRRAPGSRRPFACSCGRRTRAPAASSSPDATSPASAPGRSRNCGVTSAASSRTTSSSPTKRSTRTSRSRRRSSADPGMSSTRETLISLRRNLLMTLAGILTVTVSLLLLGGILLFQQRVDHGTNKWKHGVEFEIYMKTDATKEQIDALRNQLNGDRQVKSAKYISKEQAYNDFKRIFKDKPDLVSSVDPSALPASFRVAPTQVRQTTALRDKYNTRPGVDEAITADKAIKQLIDITHV